MTSVLIGNSCQTQILQGLWRMGVCVLWWGHGFLFGRGYKWMIFFNTYILFYLFRWIVYVRYYYFLNYGNYVFNY